MHLQKEKNNIKRNDYIKIKNEACLIYLQKYDIKNYYKKNKFNLDVLNLKNKLLIMILNLITIIFLLFFHKKNNDILRKLNYNSKIIMTIYGKGTKKIFYKDFEFLPDQILINNKEAKAIETSYYFEEQENKIELIWNHQLTNSSTMFSLCKEISKIDLSEFDASKIVNMSQMFYECNNLEYINLKNFDTSSATNISKMFFGCKKLTSIDVSNFNTAKVENMAGLFAYLELIEEFNLDNFDTSSVTSMQWMFMGCIKLKTINLTKFKTSNLINIGLFFHNCISLKSFDLSSFDTSRVECIASMFFGCESLESINLKNFKTSSVTDIRWMFQGCSKLKYLDISNFDLSHVQTAKEMFADCEKLEQIKFNNNSIINEISDMDSMFRNCKNLISLDLSFIDTYKVKNMSSAFNNCENLRFLNIPNFNINSALDMTSIFKGCKSLKILNVYSFIGSNKLNLEDIFNDILDNLIYCIQDNSQIENINSLIKQKNAVNNCSKVCDYNKKKLNSENGMCVDNCTNIATTRYEFDNICYSDCPEGTKSSFLNEFYCIKILEFTACETKDLFSKDCVLEDKNLNTTQSIINQIKYDIQTGNILSLLKNLTNDEKQELILSESNAIYQITTTDNQNNKDYNNGISVIDLGECENTLKKLYNLYKTPFIIFKTDIYQEGLLMPIVEYEIYHPYTLQKIDLDICKNDKINVYLPVTINEEDLDKHNLKSTYYNDICYPTFSSNGADLIIEDRIKEYINNNLTLCENNCKLSDYNSEKKQVLCECNPKSDTNVNSDIIIDKNSILSDFTNIKSLINLDVMKCFHLLFSKKGLSKNIGNFILLSIIVFYIIAVFIFTFKGYNSLLSQIKDLIRFKLINSNDSHSKKNKPKKIKINKKRSRKNLRNLKDRLKRHKSKKKSNIKNKNSNAPPLKKIKSQKSQKNKSSSTIFKVKNKSKDLNNKITFESNIKNCYESSNSIIKISNKMNTKSLVPKNINKSKSLFKEKTNKESNKSIILHFTDLEINTLDYKKALKYDKRTYIQYYLSLIRTKHLIIFAFYPIRDYNSTIIKICLLFFTFSCYYTINALFFNDSIMHAIYENSGGFNFIYHLPQILYSTIISLIINMIIRNLSLSDKNIIELKHKKVTPNFMSKTERVLKCLKIKFICFFVFSFVFLILFWYYLSCFCAVYQKTQIHLIKDTVISFSLSLFYQFGINLIPGCLRMNSLNAKNKDRYILYKISLIIQYI